MRRAAGCQLLIVLLLALAAGCTIQDVFRSTLGGVNSDRAAMNRINPSNEYSYPDENDRTQWNWPKPSED